MRITTVLKAAAVALAVLAFAAPTVAQEEPGSRRGSNGDPIIADLDFGGGSLEAFVRALRKAAGDSPVNIVYGPEAAGIPVPPIDLQHVDAFMALRSVSQASSSLVTRDPQLVPFIWNVDRISGDGTPVYTIQVHELSRGRASGPGSVPAAQLHTAVHSITELTTGSGAMSADDVLSAIQAALAIEGADDETKIRFHEETGLIFARVTDDQGGVIEQTLVNLRRSVEATRKSILEASDREAKEAHAQNLQTQVVLLSSQNSKLKSRIAHLETLLRSRLNGEDTVPENPLGDDPTEGGD